MVRRLLLLPPDDFGEGRHVNKFRDLVAERGQFPAVVQVLDRLLYVEAGVQQLLKLSPGVPKQEALMTFDKILLIIEPFDFDDPFGNLCVSPKGDFPNKRIHRWKCGC